MRLTRLCHLLPTVLAALFGFAGTAAGQIAPFYVLTDLGAGNSGSVAYGINATGVVAGYSTNVLGARQATTWIGGAPILLANLAGDTVSEARAINAAGRVVGFSTNAAGTADRAVSWTAGIPTNLNITAAPPFTGATPAFTQSRAEDISNTGEIVGHAYSAGTFNETLTFPIGVRGFYQSAGGAITRLDPTSVVANFPNDAALSYGLNALGQVFGQSDPGGAGAPYRPSRWSNPSGSGSIPITYPPAAAGPNQEYLGFAGNNLNRIVGTAINTAGTQSQAFAADGAANGTTLLNNIGGGVLGFANAINDAAINVIVGAVNTTAVGGGDKHAVAWEWAAASPTPTPAPVDLNTRLVANPTNMVLIEAFDVNDLGQIVGFGLVGGQMHAFLLTPVPEPGTLALCGAGLGGVAVRSWRRRRPAVA